MDVDELALRFEAIAHPPDDSDWLAVRRLARTRRTPRRRLGLVAAAAAAVAVAFSAPAFGLGGRLFRLFESGEPAPARVVRSFAALDAGAPPAFATGVVGAEARKTVLPGDLTLWLAPTRTGGFCFYAAGGGGACDERRRLDFWPIFSIGRVAPPDGAITAGPVTVAGSTLLTDAATVEIRFEDGDSASVPVTWISAPIDAGFFGYAVPSSHWAFGHRPVLAIIRDADGRQVARDATAFRTPAFRHGPSTGLVPCVVRGGGDACFSTDGRLAPTRRRRDGP